MNINDLVTGRLYKCKNELHESDFEKNEDLVMFLRIYGKNVSVLTITGVYKLIPAENLEIPERNYMELFDKETVSEFSSIMKKFFNEYQKYDGIKYSDRHGFKSGKYELIKLNELKDELKSLDLLPAISIAVENYFEVYKEIGITFNSLEDLIIDFSYIPEWEESFNDLRGFDFANKSANVKKMKKYTNEALIMHHLYTNLFIRPNLKNIRVEWLDLLLDKLRRHSTSLNINKNIYNTIESIKWQCIIEARKTEDLQELDRIASTNQSLNNHYQKINTNMGMNLNNSINANINTGSQTNINATNAGSMYSSYENQRGNNSTQYNSVKSQDYSFNTNKQSQRITNYSNEYGNPSNKGSVNNVGINSFESQLNSTLNINKTNENKNIDFYNKEQQKDNRVEPSLTGIEQLNNIANKKSQSKIPSGYTGINFSL